MKMQNADFEVILFDSRDVIATSVPGGGGGSGEASVTSIWLSKESVANFNAMADELDKLQNYVNSKTGRLYFNYYAYSGEWDDKYLLSGHSDEYTSDMTSGYRTVGAGNYTEYDEVLRWLNDHSPS